MHLVIWAPPIGKVIRELLVFLIALAQRSCQTALITIDHNVLAFGLVSNYRFFAIPWPIKGAKPRERCEDRERPLESRRDRPRRLGDVETNLALGRDIFSYNQLHALPKNLPELPTEKKHESEGQLDTIGTIVTEKCVCDGAGS